MKTFSDFITMNEGASRSLSRILEHSQTRSLAILTACRGLVDFPQVKNTQELSAINNGRNAQLESSINSFRTSLGAKNMAYIKVDGSYPEEQKDGTKIQVYEHSFLLIVDPEYTNEMIGFVTASGKKYNQDSVLIKELDRADAYLIGTNHANFPGYGKELSLGKFSSSTVSEYFTRLKGNRKFAFESFQFQAPQNALGHLANKILND